MRQWLEAAQKRIAHLRAYGPEIVATHNGGRGANHWNATINGRKALSMNVSTAELALGYARAIHAKAQKPGLPDPYLPY